MTPTNLDPVAVAVAVITALAGPKIAAIAGPYSVIVFGWVVGLFWLVYRSEPMQRRTVLLLVVLTFGVTIGATATIAEMLAKLAPDWLPASVNGIDPRALLFPVAVAIPALWDQWPILARRALLWLQRVRGGQS